MNLKTEFTAIDCEYFRQNCNFTPEELRVFNLRVKDQSLDHIAMQLGMSSCTVQRRIRNIKHKILKVL